MEKGHGFRNFVRSTLGKIIITLIAMLIIYGLIFLSLSSNIPWLIVPIGLACMIFGWKKLGETPLFIKLFASANFLLFHYIFKIILSFLIGYFVAPFQLGKMISNFVSSLGNDE